MRKTSKELQELMEKEGVDKIWSWSKINTFLNSPYEYYLKYIKKIPEDRANSIYTTTGSIAHNILEKLYTKAIKYEDMIDEYNDGWTTAFDIANLKFDRNDEEKNQSIAEGYYENLKHFFLNHTVLKEKVLIEQFAKIMIDGNLLQGYIDASFKDKDDCYTIVDFKTSTIYTGKKADKECGQLAIYALSFNQQGIPLDKIKICWNFLKYVTIQYEQKNGTIKTRNVERKKIGESLQSNAKMWLKAQGYEDELDDYLKQMIDTNDIKCLPDDVKSKYIISDCYVYVPVTESLIKHWYDLVANTIKDIELREKDYEETHNDKVFYDTEESIKEQNYYLSTLCGYSANLHKPYKAYLDKLEAAKNGSDLYSGVGSDTDITSKDIHNDDSSLDMSWLNDI